LIEAWSKMTMARGTLSLKAVICLIAASVLLPLIGLLAYTYWQTLTRVETGLRILSRASINRADYVLATVQQELRTLVENGHTSCSVSDRAVYRDLVYRRIELRGIGILDAQQKLMFCTDESVFDPPLRVTRQGDLDFGPPGSIAIVPPRDDLQAQESIFINYGHGNGKIIDAAIYPEQFWNFQDALGLGEAGAVMLNGAHGESLVALKSSRTTPPKIGNVEPDTFVQTQGHYVVSQVSQKYPVKSVAMVSKSSVLGEWYQSALLFGPFALLSGLAAAFGVSRFGRRRRSLSEKLIEAIARDELRLVYQPIVRVENPAQIVAVEALCRWTSADAGEITPDQFVAAAIRDGLLPQLSAWVWRCVCSEMKPLLDSHPGLRVSINIGRDDLKSDGLLALAIDQQPDMLKRITFEVTERESLNDRFESARNVLSSWRNRGAQIALDDFGTGCCNLAYLRNLPIDIVKLDRSFSATLDSDEATQDCAFFDAVQALLTIRALNVVAEGVEREAQHVALAVRKVQFAQGWHYAKPMPIGELRIHLENAAQRHAKA
jgi:sensor c-di-GMP phosphodiesterase-like protein